MAGQSAFGTVTRAGAAAMSQSKSNKRTGPSTKNLGPSAMRKENPAGSVRSTAGKSLKGPDKGAGGM